MNPIYFIITIINMNIDNYVFRFCMISSLNISLFLKLIHRHFEVILYVKQGALKEYTYE